LRIGPRVVNDVAPRDRDIAMVFQSYALYPHMNVAQNMGFALKLAKQDKASIAARVARVATRLGIGDLLERRPRALSGGQRQRVALGRAIVRSPAAFLMDEPLSNLDAKLRVEMRAYIARLHQELGTTTLYVTHDQTEAMTMGDRVAVMRDGKLAQVDSPQQLYEAPANMFVAGFIGSPAMNFIKGSIKVNGKAVFKAEGGLELPLATAPAGADGRPAVYGIRPEHFVIDAQNGIPAEVVVVEPTGSETQVFAKLGGQDIVGVFRERVTVGPGDTIPLAPNPELVHLFDAQTGKRL